jgi:hypothetical protein
MSLLNDLVLIGAGAGLAWLLKPEGKPEWEVLMDLPDRKYLDGRLELEPEGDSSWYVEHAGETVGTLYTTGPKAWIADRWREGRGSRESPVFSSKQKALGWLRGA